MYIYGLKNQYVILLDLFLSFEFLFKIVGFIFGRCVFSFFGIFFFEKVATLRSGPVRSNPGLSNTL